MHTHPFPGAGSSSALPWEAEGYGGHNGSPQGCERATLDVCIYPAGDLCLCWYVVCEPQSVGGWLSVG